MTNFTDPRITKWTLMSSPVSITFILSLYLWVVYIAGPNFMRNRKPYPLKIFMQCYNVFQVIVNFWLVFNVVTGGKPFAAVWKYCVSFDELCGRNTEEQFGILWWALLVKILDLSETVMFVLRKKHQQISVLHTYHHISTVLFCWVALRYFLHGYLMYILWLNGTVHVMMYSYYFLSTCGPKMQQRISPFKKWITTIQMVQILSITLLGLQGLTATCDVKGKYIGILSFFNGIANFLLFWNFYRKSYTKSKTA